MGKVEDYWDKLRMQRLQDIKDGMQANKFTQADIEWLKAMTEACEKAKNGGGQNGRHN